MVLRRIWALIIKEILAVWQDKKSRTMLFVPPIMQLLIFSWAATLDVNNVTIAVLNNDSGKWATELVQRFVGSPTFTHIIHLESVEEVQKVIDEQRAAMVLHFDKEFSRNIITGAPAPVQMILDGRKSNTTQIVQGYASRIIEKFNEDMAIQYNRPLVSSRIILRNWFNPNLIYTWFTVTGLVAILTTLIAVAITSLSVARERETGTFEQLLVSPLTPFDILVGKSVPAAFIGMIEGTVILIAGFLIYGIPLNGSIFLLYLSMFVFIWSVVGVGLFVSSLCQTQQQAILGVFVFMSPAVILSGYATPIANMPEWIQNLTYFNPLRYFIFIVRGVVLKGMPVGEVLKNIVPMAMIALTTMTCAAVLFRKRME